MVLKIKTVLVLGLIIIFENIIVFAAGFIVNPSSVKIKDVIVGKNIELLNSNAKEKYLLSIANSENRDNEYKIEIISCKQYGSSPLPGYSELPDMKCIKIKSPKIIVPAGQTGYVKDISIKIPKKKEYFGRKYQAIVKVLKEAGHAQAMNLEVVLPLFIETEFKK